VKLLRDSALVDRMLAAQAELETMVLLTRDPAFALFDTRTAW